MKLKEIKDSISKQAEREMRALGSENVKMFKLSTGSKVIYSKTKGLRDISISSNGRIPTNEEIKFVCFSLIKDGAKFHISIPKESRYVKNQYIVYITEVAQKVAYS